MELPDSISDLLSHQLLWLAPSIFICKKISGKFNAQFSSGEINMG